MGATMEGMVEEKGILPERSEWFRSSPVYRKEREGRVLLCGIAFALLLLYGRWREILARNDNTCGDSKSQNSHESLLDLTFLIAATDPKAPVY